MEIDWSKAPEGAKYHAFDKNGDGWWYENEPERSTKRFELSSTRGGGAMVSSYTLPDGMDWKQSLVKREDSNGD